MAKNWTEEDEQFIRDKFLEFTYGELAEHFDVSTKAMESKIRRMGLKKQEILNEAAQQAEAAAAAASQVETEMPETPPAPIGSLQAKPRRREPDDETLEEREERVAREMEAAEREKARREELFSREPTSKALKKLEAGVKKMMSGDYKKAASDFEAILSSPPPDSGIAARAAQFLQACEQHLEKEAPKPKTVEDLYYHGVLLLNAGDLTGAIEAFETAAEKDPKDDRILYCQAAAYAQTGNVDAALEALRRAVEKNEANRIYAKNDSDFTPLRVHREFQELVAPPDAAEDDA